MCVVVAEAFTKTAHYSLSRNPIKEIACNQIISKAQKSCSLDVDSRRSAENSSSPLLLWLANICAHSVESHFSLEVAARQSNCQSVGESGLCVCVAGFSVGVNRTTTTTSTERLLLPTKHKLQVELQQYQ